MTDVPEVNIYVVPVHAFFNLVLPGIGTMIMTCASKENVSKTQLFIGVLQFLTSVFLIGWIWALYWSYLSGKKAWDQRQLEKQGLTANQYTNSTNQ